MKRRKRAQRLISVLIALLSSSSFAAQQIAKFNQSMLVSGSARKEQRPDYPLEARQNHLQGSGVFILNISEKTGRVESIQINQSTGHRILDAAAMKALINYRFKPHTVTKVWIPVRFKLGPLTPGW
jgi:TonB family protein